MAKAARKKVGSAGLNFNHAMIYSNDVARELGFYCDLLGFKLVEDMDYGGARFMRGCARTGARERWRFI
jgi:catechol 2,3-dioxygenase-like lactoylglutathione lyase family enzyme